MLILFIIVILFLMLLIFFAGTTASARPTRPRSRLAQPQIPPTLPPAPQTRSKESRYEIRPRNPPSNFTSAPSQAQHDLFIPAASRREVDQSSQFSEAEIREMFEWPPVFGGQEKSFNWDALCRVTGQTHRVCSCEYCQRMRSRNGSN